MADIVNILQTTATILGQISSTAENLRRIRASLGEDDQATLNAELERIHDLNLQLSQLIDAAAAEAENRA